MTFLVPSIHLDDVSLYSYDEPDNMRSPDPDSRRPRSRSGRSAAPSAAAHHAPPLRSSTSRGAKTVRVPPDRSPQEPRQGGGNGGGISETARAAALTVGLVLLSRLLGIVRDMVMAAQFGQNQDATIFRAAFRVPDLIALVIAGGALSSVFVPVFIEFWKEKEEEDAWRVFGSVMSIVGVLVAFLVVGMELFSVPLTRLLNPKFATEAAIQQTAALTRILLPAQWCLLVGGLMMGTLTARRHFLIPGLAGCLYNLGQILGALFLSSQFGLSAMAWGALAGAFLGNLILPLWAIHRIGVRWHFGFDFRHPGVVRIGNLMLPVLLGQSLSQLNMWLTGLFLPEDARFAALTYAYNLTQAPIGIFAQAFAIVLLPTISEYATEKDWPAFRKTVSLGIRRVLFLTIPASVILAALAPQVIRLFLKQGKFTEADVPMAATALICYSIATFAWSASAILARGFLALQETRMPVLVTTPMVFVFLALAGVYMARNPDGYIGLPLATSFVGILTCGLLLYLLNRRVRRLNLRGIARSTSKIAVASLVAGVAAYFVAGRFDLWFIPPAHSALTDKLFGLLSLSLSGGVALLVYVAVCLFLRVPELFTVSEMFHRRR
jgi:putative peptidoglycan lipid II flippase